MSIVRKISRNVLKKDQGNNKIKEEWKKFMAFKYSPGELTLIRKRNKKKNKEK